LIQQQKGVYVIFLSQTDCMRVMSLSKVKSSREIANTIDKLHWINFQQTSWLH